MCQPRVSRRVLFRVIVDDEKGFSVVRKAKQDLQDLQDEQDEESKVDIGNADFGLRREQFMH